MERRLEYIQLGILVLRQKRNSVTRSDSSQMFDYSSKTLYFYVGNEPIKIWPVKSYELEKKL